MSTALILVAALMLVAVVIRQQTPWLRRFFIPASVVAGFLGLALVSIAKATQIDRVGAAAERLIETLGGRPGPLIAVVFAAMMLQQSSPRSTPGDQSLGWRVGRQGLMVWIIVLGETMVGLLATWWLVGRGYDLPHSFGFLIETGFAGGHGTAAAMGQVFASNQIDFPAGLDLGLLMATIGLVYGLVSGIGWINLAAHWGWIRRADTTPPSDDTRPRERQAIGHVTLPVEAIDPLLLQIVWIALAVGVGMLLQTIVMGLAGQSDAALGIGVAGAPAGDDAARAELSKRLSVSNVVDFPLFIYTMFGGWLVRRALGRFGQQHRIDNETIARLSSTAMEVLVVAAITSLKLTAIVALIGPILVLFGGGAVWTAFCLFVVSRWVLPRGHWFQLGLINYGMSTGTTATGFVLLRVVDPELRTAAAGDYALAAPLSAPFIGGGMLTIALPLLVMERVSIVWPVLAYTLVVVALIVIGRRTNPLQEPAATE